MPVSRLPVLDWDKHKSEMFDLFVTQNKTLNEVMAYMKAQHGFDATYVKIYAHQVSGSSY